ncbi:MAG: hypothetical protein V5A49_11955 [Haloarcula sp.]
MVPSTRRALLHGACGLATVLAGCSGMFEGSDESTRTASENDGSAAPGAGSESDPDAVVTRVDADRQPVWLGNGSRPTENRHSRGIESEVIDTAAKADRLAVAEDVDRSLIEPFLDGTDFDTETVYIQSVTVEECFRLTLCQISWTTNKISTDYGRVSRPYDELCAAGNTVYAIWVIRIPDTLDADDINSYSSSIGGHGCDDRRVGAEGEGGGGSAPSSDRRTRNGGEQA